MAHPPIDSGAGAHQELPDPEARFVTDLDASSVGDPEARFVVDIDKAPVPRPGGLQALVERTAVLRFEQHSALHRLQRSPLFRLQRAMARLSGKHSALVKAQRAAQRLAAPGRAMEAVNAAQRLAAPGRAMEAVLAAPGRAVTAVNAAQRLAEPGRAAETVLAAQRLAAPAAPAQQLVDPFPVPAVVRIATGLAAQQLAEPGRAAETVLAAQRLAAPAQPLLKTIQRLQRLADPFPVPAVVRIAPGLEELARIARRIDERRRERDKAECERLVTLQEHNDEMAIRDFTRRLGLHVATYWSYVGEVLNEGAWRADHVRNPFAYIRKLALRRHRTVEQPSSLERHLQRASLEDVVLASNHDPQRRFEAREQLRQLNLTEEQADLAFAHYMLPISRTGLPEYLGWSERDVERVRKQVHRVGDRYKDKWHP